jgi:hypothetical protein
MRTIAMQVIYKRLRTRSSEKDRETIATWRKRAIAFCHILIIVIAAFLVERPASGATSRMAFNAPEVALSVGRPTSALLSEIVTWLSENFGLAAIHDHPAIEYVPQTELARLRFKSLLREGSSSDGIVTRDVVALYNHDTKTIFLSDEWTGADPKELSVLVHEMVHHLQNVGNLKYECPAAREKLAYQAQDAWLKLYGGDLQHDFDVDLFTVMISSACIY